MLNINLDITPERQQMVGAATAICDKFDDRNWSDCERGHRFPHEFHRPHDCDARRVHGRRGDNARVGTTARSLPSISHRQETIVQANAAQAITTPRPMTCSSSARATSYALPSTGRSGAMR